MESRLTASGEEAMGWRGGGKRTHGHGQQRSDCREEGGWVEVEKGRPQPL